jgi:3-dehydro-L-gulonate 2-dehydrogenase
MLRVSFDDLSSALERAMLSLGLLSEAARISARLFAETTRDGVYSHGLNRFPRFEAMVRNGSIDVRAKATPAAAFGSAMCWSNTLANLPAWGSSVPTLGNNPLVIAVPRSNGEHVVLDMAMSQFSYGALASYAKRGEPLPVPGGFDRDGKLTQDAAVIETSQRALPIGYWKGSGLSLVLDMMGAMLSGGLATYQLPRESTLEAGQSQIFLAIDPANIAAAAELPHIADGILEHLHHATPSDPARPVRYPGEQTLHLREENLRLGVPVDPVIWEQINAL